MRAAAFPLSVNAIARDVEAGRAGPWDAARQALDAIARLDGGIRAWTHVLGADALAGLDAAAHRSGPLAGVPVGIKDVMDVAGMPTGHGAALPAQQARFDACCVAMLRAAGAVPVGKTVTAEFAFRSPGPTRNPHAPEHTPGGSSSGSAAAVAAGMVPAALGTQTGGSMIRPAAFCGVVGFKPSFDRVFRDGMKLTCESLDTIGWYTNSIDDARCLADVLLNDAAPRQPAGRPLLIAVQDCNPEASACGHSQAELARACARLRAAGMQCERVGMEPETARLLQAHAVIMHYEFARSLAPVVARSAEALSPALRQAVAHGLAIGAPQYRDMRALQAALRHGWDRLYGGADLVLTFSTPGPAPHGLRHTGSAAFNKIWSVLGWPCLHLPTARTPAGLPLGLQLVAGWGHDHALLAHGRRLHHLLTQEGE